MSYTTVLALDPEEIPEELAELRNSWGSAPVVWNDMAMKYLGAKELRYHDVTEDLWPLWKDQRIPEHHRAVLMMTYDTARVDKMHYARAASDIRKYLKDFPPPADRVSHWAEIAEAFERDPSCHSIGLWCTSVSENPYLGEYDEDLDRYSLFDWDTTFEVYESLDSLKS